MFNIGDKVVNAYGEEHIVIDRYFSHKEQKNHYSIQSGSIIEHCVPEEKLKLVEKENFNITVEIKILDEVVVGIIKKDGEEIHRGHGHRIHEGEDGIVQAISYAFKKCWESINGGTIINHENQNKFIRR